MRTSARKINNNFSKTGVSVLPDNMKFNPKEEVFKCPHVNEMESNFKSANRDFFLRKNEVKIATIC